MSDESFLERWSRRKREVARTEKPSESAAATPHTDEPRAPDQRAVEPAPASEPEFDLSQLPPIDSITATTDIRPFLAPGVPASLRHAALRRAWSADPTIRDFVGLSENAWDFTAPVTIPGFGGIGSPEDVRRMLARVMGEVPDPVPQAPPQDEREDSAQTAERSSELATKSEEAAAPGEPVSPPAAAPPDRPAAPLPTPQPEEKQRVALHNEDPAPAPAPNRRPRLHGRALPQ